MSMKYVTHNGMLYALGNHAARKLCKDIAFGSVRDAGINDFAALLEGYGQRMGDCQPLDKLADTISAAPADHDKIADSL